MSRLQMPPGDEPPAEDLAAERELVAQALALLDQATRDLDRAANRLAQLDGLAPEALQAHNTAELANAVAAAVRRITGRP